MAQAQKRLQNLTEGICSQTTSESEDGGGVGTTNDDLFEIDLNNVDRVIAELVIREVRNFTALNGFINVHLANEQFMDRVSVSISKRKVTNKDKHMMNAR